MLRIPKSEHATQQQITKLLQRAKSLAKRYRQITGRPLGITGEVAEVSAAHALGLELAGVRQSGFDAIRRRGKKEERLQIKGRCLLDGNKGRGRLGSIKLDTDWDAVLLVLLDSNLELLEIYEAKRPQITKALKKPGSKARNERGALAISKFKSIGKLLWSKSVKMETQ